MLPPGFQLDDGCTGDGPMFVGGVLVRQPDHAMQYLGHYPRWTLYYGPFLSQPEAVSFDSAFWLWARSNGWDWAGEFYCIFPDDIVPWPRFTKKYDWLYEPGPPPRMAREYQPASQSYQIVRVG